jgi:hypothetical protein
MMLASTLPRRRVRRCAIVWPDCDVCGTRAMAVSPGTEPVREWGLTLSRDRPMTALCVRCLLEAGLPWRSERRHH